MRYNRALLPEPADPLLAHVHAEMRRREHGPICAQCRFSPLDEHDLPRLHPLDSQPVSITVRTFRCEARGVNCHAESGHGCWHFDRQVP